MFHTGNLQLVYRAMKEDESWEPFKESLKQDVRVQLDAVTTAEAAIELARQIQSIEILFSAIERECNAALGAKNA